jgi:hypothetical protein
MSEKIKTAEQMAHASELKKNFDAVLTELGFNLDVEGWGEGLDLTDPNNAEIISNILDNILISSLVDAPKDIQENRLLILMERMPRELSLVRNFIHLFRDGVKVASN